MVLMPDFRYSLLVSAGYAFMMLLIGVSVLRVDRLATLLTGSVCFAGNAGLVAWTLISPSTEGSNPHPSTLCFNLALMLTVSDGFFEWTNEDGEAFGLERLQEVIRDHRHQSATEILEAMEYTVRRFVGDLPQQDDVTGLIIKRLCE